MDAKIFVNIFFDLLKQENLLEENEAISLDYAGMIYFLVRYPLYQAQVHDYQTFEKVIEDSKDLKKNYQYLRSAILGWDVGVLKYQNAQKESYIYLPAQSARHVCSQSMPDIKPSHGLTSGLLAKYPPQAEDKFQLQDLQNNDYAHLLFEIESTETKPTQIEKERKTEYLPEERNHLTSFSTKKKKIQKKKLLKALANDPRTEELLQGEPAIEKLLEFDRSNLLSDSISAGTLAKIELNNTSPINWLWFGSKGEQLPQDASSNLQSDSSIQEEKIAEALANNITPENWAWFEPARKRLSEVPSASPAESDQPTQCNIYSLLN